MLVIYQFYIFNYYDHIIIIIIYQLLSFVKVTYGMEKLATAHRLK